MMKGNEYDTTLQEIAVVFPPPPASSSSTTSAPKGFENLVAFMSTRKQGWSMKMSFRVDFAHGTLTIRRLVHDDDYHGKTWCVSFSYDILTMHSVAEYFEDEKDVVKYIHGMGTSKFVRPNQFLTNEEYKEYIDTFTLIMGLTGRDLETCYVCQEPTYGHKTKCRHDICISCFYKSCKQTSRSNTFRCGICRHDWKCYTQDHDDYTDDDDDE